MKSFFSAIFVIAALAFPQAGSAQDAPPIHVLPVDRTPFHVIAFANEYVRMLNAEIPAGRVASYHQHSTDSAFVIVESAKVRAQEMGGEAVERENPTPSGTISYLGYSKKPGIHQVTNVDSTPFHVVGFEIMYPEAGRFAQSSREEVSAYKLVLDNERVRAWRLVLDPGHSAPPITQKAPGVRIVVKGGTLVESEVGYPNHEMVLKSGDFIWQEQDVTRTLRNVGTAQIELVEFELR